MWRVRDEDVRVCGENTNKFSATWPEYNASNKF